MVHGVAGGFLAELGGQEFSTGAIAAASAELLSTSLAEISDPQMRAQMAGAIAATGAMLAGGDAEDVQLANQTAQMVITYNHNMHPDFKTKMNAQLAKAKEEGDDKYGDLDQEKLAELQEVCGDTHCFNTFWGGIDTNKINKYLSENGGTAYSPETLEAYADLHSSTEDILLTKNNDLNWGIINNPDGSGQIVKMEPLYIPDENDYKAAALLLQQNGMMPDDVYNQLDEAEWNQFNTDLEAARQLDPALGEAFSFMESEQNKQLLAFVAAEALGEAGPLVLAKIIAAVRVAKTAKLYSKRPTEFAPMDSEQFTKIQEAFSRQGKTIDNSEDALRYLETREADGVTFNAETILVRKDASPSTVFEELIHATQHRTGKFGTWVDSYGNSGAVAKAEFEAATRLVKNQKAYGISNAEHLINLSRVKHFEIELIKLGVPID